MKTGIMSSTRDFGLTRTSLGTISLVQASMPGAALWKASFLEQISCFVKKGMWLSIVWCVFLNIPWGQAWGLWQIPGFPSRGINKKNCQHRGYSSALSAQNCWQRLRTGIISPVRTRLGKPRSDGSVCNSLCDSQTFLLTHTFERNLCQDATTGSEGWAQVSPVPSLLSYYLKTWKSKKQSPE